MVVDFKYEIGQVVYYVLRGAFLSQDSRVVQGVIQGFQVRKHEGKIYIGVDFRGYNNINIELVSDDREKLQKIVDSYNALDIGERIIK